MVKSLVRFFVRHHRNWHFGLLWKDALGEVYWATTKKRAHELARDWYSECRIVGGYDVRALLESIELESTEIVCVVHELE